MVMERVAVAVAVAEPGQGVGGLSARRAATLLLVGVVATASLLLLLPKVADLPGAWSRLASGDGRWLLVALALEALSFLGHIVLFRAVSLDSGSRVGMRASTEITLAGHVATRLFASGGAGGVALTAWAMRRSGMEGGDVAARMTTFLVVLYSVYMAALVVGGLGLYAGVLPGDAPTGLTLVPAVFGAVVMALALALPLLTGRLRRLAERRGGRVARAAPLVAAIGDGVRDSLRLARRLDPGLVGAVLWWGADIAVLWACFQAFGAPPAVAVVVMAYFVGMLANTLPLPGGVGGVDGGMIGALIAFGVQPGLAVVAVLAYRGFAFWLPIAPGVAAWLSLRRTVAGWEREDAAAPAVAPAPWLPPVAVFVAGAGRPERLPAERWSRGPDARRRPAACTEGGCGSL
jgi:uncharacterized protein (TIRG00374 family)